MKISVNKTNGPVDQIKIVFGIALLAALTGCVGYVDGGYGGDVVVGGPVVVGGVWDAGFVGRDVVHGYSSRGAASRSVAHSGGRGGGGRGGGSRGGGSRGGGSRGGGGGRR
jgi:hypothetical protein